MARKQLLIGCGASRERRLRVDYDGDWEDLTTLDFSPDTKPDVVHNLELLPLPFGNDTFDEIHAYEVLEHTGQQGDFRFFFDQFSDFWRILRPDGLLVGSSPHWGSKWAWGDPGHKRIISGESFIFLNQIEYVNQIGKTPMSDYRWYYRADFETQHLQIHGDILLYVLKAVKPSRIT